MSTNPISFVILPIGARIMIQVPWGTGCHYLLDMGICQPSSGQPTLRDSFFRANGSLSYGSSNYRMKGICIACGRIDVAAHNWWAIKLLALKSIITSCTDSFFTAIYCLSVNLLNGGGRGWRVDYVLTLLLNYKRLCSKLCYKSIFGRSFCDANCNQVSF